MIPAEPTPGKEQNTFCASCRLNQTIPDLSRDQNHDLWRRMEMAKRRLVYTLLLFKLPLANKYREDPEKRGSRLLSSKME